jgi:sodium-dependent dicarboxylate transporter 2/3/5
VSGKGSISLPHPGSWKKAEIRTLTIFGLTALAWITRSEPFGGWKTWLDLPQANDASVAFVAVLLLFVLPNGEKKESVCSTGKPPIKYPGACSYWSGAGLCLGEGFKQSGLSESIASALSGMENLPTLGC